MAEIFAIKPTIKYPELPPEYRWMKEVSESQNTPEAQAWIAANKARAEERFNSERRLRVRRRLRLYTAE
jgi:hypothetical protein